MSEEMEKMKYEDFLKTIVKHQYDTIGMENDLLEKGKKPTFKITFKRGEWVHGNNSCEYQNKTYYYDFSIDDIINLILDLLYERDKQTKNRILSAIERNNDNLLKELENE